MIPELTLDGSPSQRGQAHGEHFRDLIAETIERWFEVLAPRIDPIEFVAEILHVAGFREAIETHTPELMEEVRGLADGAAQSVEAMFAWQLIDECWWYLDDMTGQSVAPESCSAFAINDGTNGIVAQTQDLYRHFDGSQIMLRYRYEDGLEVLAPSAAGLLAYNGVNSAGLAVCITTLNRLAHQTGGVGSGFVVPSLLQCRSVDEALRWLQETPLASGNSWTLGSRDRSMVVEVSATSTAVAADGAQALHTNHAFALDPVHDDVRFDSTSSLERFAQLEATITPTIGLDEIKAMYAQGAICLSRSGPGDLISVGTMIFELGDTQLCHFAAGPLDTDAVVTYQMAEG